MATIVPKRVCNLSFGKKSPAECHIMKDTSDTIPRYYNLEITEFLESNHLQMTPCKRLQSHCIDGLLLHSHITHRNNSDKSKSDRYSSIAGLLILRNYGLVMVPIRRKKGRYSCHPRSHIFQILEDIHILEFDLPCV